MTLPSPRDPSVFWVVDGNHPFCDALTWMDDLMMPGTTVKVYSVRDLVKACCLRCIEQSTAIDFLAIFGHGTGGYQSIGAGKAFEPTGTKSLRFRGVFREGESHLFGPAEKTLNGLNGTLSDQATVFCGGCNVGEGDYGSGLLSSVSTILGGRTVQAFEWQVFWWTGVLVGPLKEAKGDSTSSSFSTYSF
jgi:hypothetical protein